MSEHPERLTSADPEPPPGTLVRDDFGREWYRDDSGPVQWTPREMGDPESWTKIAGNYGPVTVLNWGDEICEIHDVPMTGGVCSSCLADSEANGR